MGAIGRLSLNVKYYSPMTSICIIRVGRDHHKIAWGALTLLTSVDEWSLLGVELLPISQVNAAS
ncbi:hypothetical protein BDN72DRAFT_849644 [Pluteus cervinus]|uniref:Uncharacterized protein n=1 Tax=Pluteus cervinus TaxID=181527 RepID=A0ACD3A825_9AGAR|nr:hypothetical protein BDN72DRAFT_849644 [Pluteus cervinus]